MKIQLVAFRRCFAWLGAGWYAFKSNLGAWLALSIIFLLFQMLLGMLPFVGIFLIAFFMPFLLTGLLVTAHKSLVGSLAQVEDALLGFNDLRFRKPLLILGVAATAGTLLVFIALFPLTGEILKALYMPQSNAQVAEVLASMAEGSPFGLMLQTGVILVVMMAFFYATPLVVFENQEPLDAITTSLLACLKNIVPLALFTGMVLVLGVLASLMFGLGYLVLLPILAGATYASFRDVFDPVEPPVPDLSSA
ncbi:MAG: hypothetical protein KJ914_11855 [Gammaproteobacteria bacterium]|nr:hypothetical protein [Gammaproteobacteria bacterium]MBU1723577.1 hypothetical protein [Gammaproteobacteria bacterium]MBU2004135.1 hypothetical protein [Gammaproteobacteria bacterium]